MLRRRFLLLGFTLMALVGRSEPSPVVVPPEPEQPKVQDMTPEQRRAAFEKWRADRAAWQKNLTPEQTAEVKRRAADAARRREEESERRQRLPLPKDGYTWQQAATAQKLGATVIEQLSRDKIAYGATVKQSFTPYFGGPVFITADSVLNGFHVLFEDTFRERELREIGELRKNLEAVVQNARKNLSKSPFTSSDTSPAWRHAQIVVGPALCLLGAPLDLCDLEVREEIQGLVTKIRSAQLVELPSWLEPATDHLPALDYRFCKPVGFYAGDEKLADYFRAVRWLQMIPFRMDRDVELAAIGMLGYGANAGYVSTDFRAYSEVLGPTDTPGLPEASHEFQNFFSFPSSVTWDQLIAEKRKWLLRKSWPQDPETGQRRPGLPANSGELLAKIQFHVLPPYLLPDTALFQALADQNLEPDGLATAAFLGSKFAEKRFTQFTREQFQVASDRAKSRPTFRTQQDESSLYDDYLDVLRTLFAPPAKEAPAFMHSEAWQAKSTQTALAGWAQLRHTFTLQVQRSELYLGMSIVPPGFVEPNPEFFSRMADLVERARSLLDEHRDRWDELASITRKLEALAHKQLRQESWSATDEKFLKTYGERLGLVMGYYSNSYEVPNDDAPRWVEVHHDTPQDFSLVAAVGRPRILYVLYPWNGMEILCRGAAMPYYEYHSRGRLTDTEWKSLLDSPNAPLQPEWLRPFLAK